MRFHKSDSGDAIIDFRGRRLTRAAANGRPIPARNAAKGHIRIPARLLKVGQNQLDFAFVADIAPSGASIIRSHDPTDGSDYFYTLLVPADANQLFPSFDQPDVKARVRLTLITPTTGRGMPSSQGRGPQGQRLLRSRAPALTSVEPTRAWSVVANGAIESTDTSDGRLITRFAETRVCASSGNASGKGEQSEERSKPRRRESPDRHRPACKPAPISTYLIAFAAGPWHHASATQHGRTITAYVRASRAGEADLDSLLSLNHRALDWMERYFGRPYPFEKFEFVLAPAFPFGGMEHPGAVFYNEDRFIFRERPTLPQRLNRFATILHEVAHQWFGDLVTMRWFDDLWLKEGFATFMAAKALAEIDPSADAWKTFYLSNKPPAYAVDQTAGTRPLWQELANLDQAKSNYGAIVYNKAPSVLKQLEYLVGDSAFQIGVQQFLNRHAYANATWQDLLGAIGRSAHRPLDGFGRDFMLRPGMPVLEQQLTLRDGKIARLALTQHPAQSLSGNGPWTERTEVLLSYSDRPPVRVPAELKGRVTEVSEAAGKPAPDFVFANARDYGYFLLLLDSASVHALESGALSRVNDPFLRAMLWGSLWDQVRNYRMKPDRFVRLALGDLARETDEQVVPFVLARLGRAVSAHLIAAARDSIQAVVEQTLWQAAGDRSRPYGIRKAYVDAFLELAGSPQGVARLDTLFSADSVAGEPLKDPTRWDIATRLLELAAPQAESRYENQVKRDTTADGQRRAFIAAAGRPDSATKRSYFTRYFADATLNEDWASGSLGEFNVLEHQAVTFPYLRPALDSLPFIQTHRRIFYLETWLAAFLRGQTGDSALAVVRGYLEDHPRLPLDLRRKVLQHADELERTVRIRQQQRSRLNVDSTGRQSTER